MSNEIKHGLTLEISTAAGDVLVTATLRLTPAQAVRLAELLQEYAAAAQTPEPKTKPRSTRKEPHARP